MNNQIIIYGATKERAFEKLQDLLDNMKYGDIQKVRKGQYDFIVDLKNGDRYIAIRTSNNGRGYKWQYAYIDRLILEELLNNLVFPNFVPLSKNGLYDRSVDIHERFNWFE